MSEEPFFTRATFKFLKDLKRNNDREWFQANKEHYESNVREPALSFIQAFGPRLKKISTHFLAIPKPSGGSMFRIHRDTRFSKDKSPYKTYVGVQFRHERARDAHAPGFYLHIDPGNCGVGVGMWHPDNPTLNKVRGVIAEDGAAWKKAVHSAPFGPRFELVGESLKRPPKGHDPDHPYIEDLKRKDLIGWVSVTDDELTSAGFMEEFAATCRAGAPLNRFLCEALGLEY